MGSCSRFPVCDRLFSRHDIRLRLFTSAEDVPLASHDEQAGPHKQQQLREQPGLSACSGKHHYINRQLFCDRLIKHVIKM